ncbi:MULTISPECIES: ABC transporter ATP-binding protein [unclassified Haladaptatus]|uniref:ABC transporter ATP-binding protein n=1 Tax=unclassified Haladaptatus TaxID=2622732 RepID=UPI0023E7A140|nr:MULTISPECIES: ABC transporter ATP-binding protein [unclassified Haladaptatus]
MSSIQTRGLTKQFGDLVAVSDLDLTVPEGEVFGFLGPNGAGKSTTINLILDFIRPTAGTVEVLGIDAQKHPEAVRERVGVLPEGYGFEDSLTGREHVAWAIETKSAADDPDALLSQVGLSADAERLASSYSKGMQQRLAFAMALAGDPEVLILDEPSSGLDPNGMQDMRELIRERAEAGTTVFFSSHILSEVEAICDRVGVMNDGELVAVDTIDGLRETTGGQATIELTCATSPTTLGVETIEGVAAVSVEENTLVATCTNPSVKVDVVSHVAAQAEVRDILSDTVSLESLFNELTGNRHERGEIATQEASS